MYINDVIYICLLTKQMQEFITQYSLFAFILLKWLIWQLCNKINCYFKDSPQLKATAWHFLSRNRNKAELCSEAPDDAHEFKKCSVLVSRSGKSCWRRTRRANKNYTLWELVDHSTSSKLLISQLLPGISPEPTPGWRGNSLNLASAKIPPSGRGNKSQRSTRYSHVYHSHQRHEEFS